MTVTDDLAQKLQNPRAWSRIWLSQYAERAHRPDNPAFLRVGDLAVALAPANGHANLKADELRKFLGVTDYRTVDKAIADAVLYGILAPGSSRRCLILPAGVDGFCIRRNPNARATEQERPCAVCHTGRPANPADCHPDKPRHTKDGLCQGCYRRERRAGTR